MSLAQRLYGSVYYLNRTKIAHLENGKPLKKVRIFDNRLARSRDFRQLTLQLVGYSLGR